MEKIIIAIVGMPGAGKSEAALFFKNKNIPILRFGDETDLGLKELGYELTESNERWYREKLRKELGMAAYAIRIKPRIDTALKKSNMVVLDGLYSHEEYVYLDKLYPGLRLLCIYANPNLRYTRLTGRSHRRINKHEARSRDFAELEKLNKGGPIAIADYLIKNEGTINDLNQELTAYFSAIEKK